MTASIFTPWGYSVASLPALMTVSQFNTATGNKYADIPQAQVEAAIDAASAAVRNVCGWHVSPSLRCTATITAGDELTGERVRRFALPAAYVSGIYSVTEDGGQLSSGQFAAMQNGLMQRTCFKAWSNRINGVTVEYEAGFDAATVPDFTSAVCHVIEAALTIPAGVASEMAGGVSISYKSEASAVAAMVAQQMAPALKTYKVVRAYAA